MKENKIKSLIKRADKSLLGEVMTNAEFDRKLRVTTRSLSRDYKYSYTCYYSHSAANPISRLCDKYGSDKGSNFTGSSFYKWHAHTYADLYFEMFHHCRHHLTAVFECGLGTNKLNLPSTMGETGRPGASLRVWKEYFENAVIYGVDIDRDTLFNDEDRIRTFYVDQTCPEEINKMWQLVGDVVFDLMIDDGLHTFDAGVALFEGSISRLKPDGVYIIEDVQLSDIPRFKDYFRESIYNVRFYNLYRPGVKLDDNSLIVIRKTNNPGL
jgi:hypothetical protein